jgi:branched-chain amino acid transport system substrate-binding protein
MGGEEKMDHRERGKNPLFRVLTGLFVMALIAASCSSSSKKGSGAASVSGTGSVSGTNGSSSGSKTYTIGLLTDVTGPAATSKTSVQGVEAGITVAAPDGYHIKYVVGDTGTSPAGALTAAQKLVNEDHVLAVVMVSQLGFGAAPFLNQHGVPVIGTSEDGPEWATNTNMFSVQGPQMLTQASTLTGQFMKMQGVGNFGAIAYGISPSSVASAKGAAISAQTAGIKLGYLNTNLAFGTTNLDPIALGMKNGGVDGFTVETDPNTGFGLINALKNHEVDIKAALLPAGYGGDLYSEGPGAEHNAQGVYFSSGMEPFEMQTAATKKMANALHSIGVDGDPTYPEYQGYASIALLEAGLKAAGPNPSQASLIKGLDTVTSFDAYGLYGNHRVNVAGRQPQTCSYITKFVGTTFQLVPAATPICGTTIPGKKISS